LEKVIEDNLNDIQEISIKRIVDIDEEIKNNWTDSLENEKKFFEKEMSEAVKLDVGIKTRQRKIVSRRKREEAAEKIIKETKLSLKDFQNRIIFGLVSDYRKIFVSIKVFGFWLAVGIAKIRKTVGGYFFPKTKILADLVKKQIPRFLNFYWWTKTFSESAKKEAAKKVYQPVQKIKTGPAWAAKLATAGLGALVVSVMLGLFVPGATAHIGKIFDQSIIDSGKKIKVVVGKIIHGKNANDLRNNFTDSTFGKHYTKWNEKLIDKSIDIAISLEDNIKHRNKLVAKRLGVVGDQVIFIAKFWQGEYNQKIEPVTNKGVELVEMTANKVVGILNDKFIQTNLVFKLLPNQIQKIGQSSLGTVISFADNLGQTSQKIIKDISGLVISDERNKSQKGRVAGVTEEKEEQFTSRLLAMASITANRSRQVVDSAKDNVKVAFNQSADAQKDLSYILGEKMVDLTLASAQKVARYSQSSSNKLAQATTKAKETNQAIKEYNQSGKDYLAKETVRSALSLGDIYTRVIDFIIPDSLKSRYAQMYQTDTEEKLVETERIVTGPVSTQMIVRQPLSNPNKINGNLDITGNVYANQELNVGGPARFDDKLTVLGGVDILNGLYNSQGILKIDDDLQVTHSLTTKTLRVEGKSEFSNTINAVDIWANNLLARENLRVVGDSTIQGNETIEGDLTVNGSFTSGQAIFANLGVTGLLGVKGASVGEYGLFSSGVTTLRGDVNITGRIDADNILDIDKSSAVALTVGDGTTNTFTVNTSSDIITLAGTTYFNGPTIFNGDMDLNGALDIDVVSTSALTVGDGIDDNLRVDTVNDQLIFGNSSTTDTIITNTKQITVNSASSTPAILVNYDGTGNMIQLVDNAINRFTIADHGKITQTASTTDYALNVDQTATSSDIFDFSDQGTSRLSLADWGVLTQIASTSTGYAYTLNQAGTGGNILAIQDEGTDRFLVADYGVITQTASSTDYAYTLNQAGETGNLLAIRDQGTDRFLVLDYGDISQTASTTDYAYTLNQTGTTGSLLDIQDEGFSRFTIADYGVANLIASSTSTALTVKQTDTGNLLDIYDDDNLALTVLDGGNVGIGTSSPDSLLHLYGATTTLTIDDGIYSHQIINSQAEGLAGADLRIGLDESNRMLIIADKEDVGSDFGLSTASDPFLLVYNADGDNYAGIHGSGVIYVKGSSHFIYEANDRTVVSGAQGASFVMGTDRSTGSAFQIISGSGDEITASSGEQAWLDIQSKVNQSSTAGYAGIKLKVTETSLGSGNNYLMQLGTSTAESLFVVDNNGNVGIGTTSPFVKLSVAGDTYLGGNLTATGTLTVGGAIFAPYFVATDADATSTFAGGLTVDSTKFVVDPDSGRVGIGTASPESLIHISKDLTTNFLDYFKIENPVLSSDELVGITFSGRQQNDGKAFIGIERTDKSYGIGDIVFLINNVLEDTAVSTADEVMRITSAGNVGIGTTTPWGQLSVEGQGSKPELVVTGTDMTPDFIVDEDGNVGIATTSPDTKLTVDGNAKVTGISYFGPTSGYFVTDVGDIGSSSYRQKNFCQAKYIQPLSSPKTLYCLPSFFSHICLDGC